MVSAVNANDTMILAPQAVTAAATALSSNVDCAGADWATIRVALSNIAQATIASADGVTIKLEEADNTNVSNFATIVANRTAIKFSREIRYEVDTRTRKRYLRLSVIPGTSGVTNEPVTAAAFATLSRLAQSPSATNVMVAGTNDAVVVVTS